MRNIILILFFLSVTKCTFKQKNGTVSGRNEDGKKSQNTSYENNSHDSNMVDNDGCIYDYNALDDTEFRGKFNNDIYIWDNEHKTAKVMFKNSEDSLIIKMYACIHKGVSIELFLTDSNTLEVMRDNFDMYVEKVIQLSSFIISNDSFVDLEKDLRKMNLSDGDTKNDRIFFDVSNKQFTYCGFVLSKNSSYSTSIFFEYYN